MARPGSTTSLRSRQPDGSGLVAHDGGQLGSQIGHRRRIILRQIRNAESTAQVDDRHLRCLLDAEFGDHVAQKTDHAVCGDLEARDIEDLRSDVAVQADQTKMVGGEHAAHGSHGRATGERQAEFLIFVCGGDEFVGVRFDADGDAHQHVLDDTRRTGNLIETFDLGHRVERPRARCLP